MKLLLAFSVLVLMAVGCRTNHDATIAEDANPPSDQRPGGKANLKVKEVIGSDTDPSFLFSRIDGIEVDDDGRLYVLDRGARNIRVFSAGTFMLEKVFPIVQGEGPGEYNDIYAISLAPDGGTLALSFPSGIALLDTSFAELRRIRLARNTTPKVKYASQDYLIVSNSPHGVPGACCIFDVYTTAGELQRSFGRLPPTFDDMSRRRFGSGFGNTYFAVDGDNLVLGFGFPYDIRLYNWHTGDFVRKFARLNNCFGDEFSRASGMLMHRCIIGGVAIGSDDHILVFESDYKRDELGGHNTLVNFRSNGDLRWVANLDEELGMDTPILNVGRSYKSGLVVEVDTPVPGIAILSIDS